MDEVKLNIFFNTIHLEADSEYGTHVYFSHSFEPIEFSYFTEYEDIGLIMLELDSKIKERQKERDKFNSALKSRGSD